MYMNKEKSESWPEIEPESSDYQSDALTSKPPGHVSQSFTRLPQYFPEEFVLLANLLINLAHPHNGNKHLLSVMKGHLSWM